MQGIATLPGSALSFERSGGAFSGPAPFGWTSSAYGCATAWVAAENLGRRWIGVDISPKAVELVNMRLQQSTGDLFHNRLVTARTDIPRRTDIDAPGPTVRTSTCSSASKKAGAMVAVASSLSASLRWTPSSPAEEAASTTSRTSSCCAPTAITSRVTDRKNTCWPSCANCGS